MILKFKSEIEGLILKSEKHFHCGTWIYIYLFNKFISSLLKFMSSISNHSEVYFIQLYLIKLVSYFWQVCGFLQVHSFLKAFL